MKVLSLRQWVGLACLLAVCVALLARLMVSGLGAAGPEVRLVSRERSTLFLETSIVRVPFREFVGVVRDRYPGWRIGFSEHEITFRSAGGHDVVVVQPGTVNPDSRWNNLGDSEQWSTLFLQRPPRLWDWLVPQVSGGATQVVDIPLRYRGLRDRHGFELKLDSLPDWLSDIYRQRTSLKASAQGGGRQP